jgi:membrane protein
MNALTERPAAWRARALATWRGLRRWPWLDTLRTLRQRFREDRLGLTAGSLTFTTTIALVPMMTVMLAIFSAFPMFSRFQQSLQKYLIESLVPDNIARPVLGALTQFAAKANKLGSVGLVVLVLTALALLLTIDRTLNAIWRVRQPRPFAQRVLMYWAGATLGPLLLGVSLSLSSYALSASRGLVQALPGGVNLLLNALEFLVVAGGMAAVYKFVPNTYVRWTHAWAGGLAVAAGLELAKRGLAAYLASVPTYSVVYGAFATVPILLIWIYVSWVVVLLGAVIAAYAPSLQMGIVRRPQRPGARFELALAVLGELDAARREGGGLTAPQLAERLRTDPLQVEALLETLQGFDWVGRLDEEGARRHVLLRDPAGTPARPLLAELLLDPAGPGASLWREGGFEGLSLAALMRDRPDLGRVRASATGAE